MLKPIENQLSEIRLSSSLNLSTNEGRKKVTLKFLSNSVKISDYIMKSHSIKLKKNKEVEGS